MACCVLSSHQDPHPVAEHTHENERTRESSNSRRRVVSKGAAKRGVGASSAKERAAAGVAAAEVG